MDRFSRHLAFDIAGRVRVSEQHVDPVTMFCLHSRWLSGRCSSIIALWWHEKGRAPTEQLFAAYLNSVSERQARPDAHKEESRRMRE